MKNRITLTLTSLGVLVSSQLHSYPFTLPTTLQAEVHIDSSGQETFNNKLLGTNIFGFTSSTDQGLINLNNPITVRFPHGLWANWYDWHTDTSRVFGTETFTYTHADGSTKTTSIDHLSSLKIFENNNIKVGINGLTQLNNQQITNQGQGFDMLWTFNMSADGSDFDNGSPESVARYQDLIARGFKVNAIEMGNENFYPGQRSSIIPDAKDYIARAKSMSKALKALNPNLRLSIPLLRRGSWANPDWNQDLTADQDYFDAITVHTYVGSDPDNAENSDEAYSTALTARHHLAKSIDDYAGQVAPDKPIWLSEWGVKSGGANAVSVLGMADAYLFMSENQDRYERANWFSVNGQLNSFYVWETYTTSSGVERPRIKYPLEKTAFGQAYEVIRDVFEDSVMISSNTVSPELITGVQAISSRTLVKEGKTYLFVINLTNKNVPLTAKINGSSYNGNLIHQALSFNWMGEERQIPESTQPMSLIQSGSGAITLPKFSLNVIQLEDANLANELFTASVSSPIQGGQFNLGQSIALTAEAFSAQDDIQQVNFRVNGAFLKADLLAPYHYDWTPDSAGSYSVDVVAIKTDGSTITSTAQQINVNADHHFVHLTKTNNNGFSIDGGTGASAGQQVKLWSTNINNINQQWQEIPLAGDYYQYKKRDTLFCLDAGNNGENAQLLTLQTCDTFNQNQQFIKQSYGAQQYQLIKRNASNYAIDGGNAGAKNQDVKLWQMQTTADSNQIWTFTQID